MTKNVPRAGTNRSKAGPHGDLNQNKDLEALLQRLQQEMKHICTSNSLKR